MHSAIKRHYIESSPCDRMSCGLTSRQLLHDGYVQRVRSGFGPSCLAIIADRDPNLYGKPYHTLASTASAASSANSPTVREHHLAVLEAFHADFGPLQIAENADMAAYPLGGLAHQIQPPRVVRKRAWEKLMRTTSTPARTVSSMIRGSSVAGPNVATILARRRMKLMLPAPPGCQPRKLLPSTNSRNAPRRSICRKCRPRRHIFRWPPMCRRAAQGEGFAARDGFGERSRAFAELIELEHTDRPFQRMCRHRR